MKRIVFLVAPLALAACGAPAPSTPPKEPPPIVAAPSRPVAEPVPQPPPPAPAEIVQPEPKPRPEPTPAAVLDVSRDAPSVPVAPPPAAPSRTAPAPVDTSADSATVAASKRLERERRQQRVRDAEAKIAELEKRQLAISNPLLPRPQLPPEEEEAWRGLDGVERRKRVNGQLDEARRELEKAQAELKALPGY